MAKNIVLCSDGTGNKGGYTPDSNVYRLYNALDYNAPDQVSFYDNGVGTANNKYIKSLTVSFYDNGVGTANNKYIKSLTGAFGLGFNQNVMDLYEFLVRHYTPGDKVFLFGFSRGAATVRAFAGLLQVVGLLDRSKPGCADEDNLEAMLDCVKQAYKSRPKFGETDPAWEKEVKKLRSSCMVHVGQDWRIPITFLGVWDTVSALGFPQDWSRVVNWMFDSLDFWTDKVFHQHCYEYQLDDRVECACHALALDDERKTFHPHVFWEKPDPRGRYTDKTRPKHLHQVWFAGVHSNVGGGYERAGMASVTLHWMMCWALRYGLKLDKGALDDVEAASNVTDFLYDSRDGFAAYYRYAPRNIEHLWGNRFRGPIKVHASVDKRIRQGTARYAPGYLPYQIELVETPSPIAPADATGKPDSQNDLPMPKMRQTAPTQNEWQANRKEIDTQVERRSWNYRLFVETTLGWVVLAIVLDVNPVSPPFPGAPNDYSIGPFVQIAEILHPLVPGFLEPFIEYVFISRPIVGGLFLLWIFAFFLSGRLTRRLDLAAREKARKAYLSTNEGYTGAFKQSTVATETESRISRGWIDFRRKILLPVWLAPIVLVVYSLVTYKAPTRACGDYAGHPIRTVADDGRGASMRLDTWKEVSISGVVLKRGTQYRVAYVPPAGGFNPIPKENLESVSQGANPRVTDDYLAAVPVDSPDHWLDASIIADPGKGWWPTIADGLMLYGGTQLVTAFSQRGLLRLGGENLSIPVGVIRGPCRGGLTCEYQFPIHAEGTVFEAPGDGEFCAFANDLAFMEFNNKGSLDLTVTRDSSSR